MASYLVVCGCSVITMMILRKLLELRWGKCSAVSSLKGKIVVITGATSGLGLATAKNVVKRGATVIMACRDMDKCSKIVNEIVELHKIPMERLVPVRVDLASLKSVREFSAFLRDYRKIDFLLLNAGVYMPLEESQKNGKKDLTRTEDGFEVHMGVNHLSHFLITNLILPKLMDDETRVVIVSSMLHKHAQLDLNDINYGKGLNVSKTPRSHSNLLYNNSKLANVLFNKELATRLDGTGAQCCCLCPGLVYTGLGRHVLPTMPFWKKLAFLPVMFFFMRTPHQGIQTILYCMEEKTIVNGGLYRNCRIESDSIRDPQLQKDLWRNSEKLVGLAAN